MNLHQLSLILKEGAETAMRWPYNVQDQHLAEILNAMSREAARLNSAGRTVP